MTTEALKSAAITNLDATPPVAVQAGNGAVGYVKRVLGYITMSASMAAGSTYRMVRIPTTARDVKISLESEAQGAGKVNVSAYYSDSTVDGTPVANQGLIVPTTGDQFWASDVDLASAYGPTDVTNESGNNTLDKRGKELWDALGLTSDPGGFIDVVLVVHTTAVTTGTGKTGVSATYVQ